jgi:hypothetical protein
VDKTYQGGHFDQNKNAFEVPCVFGIFNMPIRPLSEALIIQQVRPHLIISVSSNSASTLLKCTAYKVDKILKVLKTNFQIKCTVEMHCVEIQANAQS